MLEEVFGYDKYADVTSEHAIRGTFCDLAIRVDGSIATLIEVKAIGLELKDAHTKQAVDYAANKGVDWVLLTNGQVWRVYRIHFSKPIEQELVVDVDFAALSPRSQRDIALLYLWCKEGWVRSVLGEYHKQRQALSRYLIGAIIQTDAVVDVVRRELRRVSPDVQIASEQIRSVLVAEVLKREVLEGENADAATKRVARAAKTRLKAKASTSPAPQAGQPPPESS
jgi:predicted type IV restriction endonuclease